MVGEMAATVAFNFNMNDTFSVSNTHFETTSNMTPNSQYWKVTTSVYDVTEYRSNVTEGSAEEVDAGPLTWDDATWILTSSFIIFTMQSGFGLLEAGCVSSKNEVNIMVKNAVDVVFGGITYWLFGYGLSFGTDPGSNGFVGVGKWMVDTGYEDMGYVFSTFIFQLSFATTATTIVSGAMAERTKLSSYMIFSMLNTVIYCVPAHWIWSEQGFLYQLGCIDVAGSGGVHLVGGTSALVATMLLGPRLGKFKKDDRGGATPEPGNPTNCMVGMFMLWWGWLGFNCGSTFGISGGKWKLASKSAVTTINASMGGGLVGIFFSVIFKKHYCVPDLVNGILGALVSVTAGCAVIRPYESILIGVSGGLICILGTIVLEKLHVDDPVGAVPVHGIGGMWGMLMVGVFAGDDPVEKTNRGMVGLVHGGGFHLMWVQAVACLAIVVWSGTITFVLLYILKKTMGIRLSVYEEIMGADYIEHRIGSGPSIQHILEENGETIKDMEKGILDINLAESPHVRRRSSTVGSRSSFGFKAKMPIHIPETFGNEDCRTKKSQSNGNINNSNNSELRSRITVVSEIMSD